MLGMWRPNINGPFSVQCMWTLTALSGLAVRPCLPSCIGVNWSLCTCSPMASRVTLAVRAGARDVVPVYLASEKERAYQPCPATQG